MFITWYRLSVNHKDIRSLYIIFRYIFRLLGSSFSHLIWIELTTNRSSYSDSHSFNVFTTAHRLVIVFFFLMPYLIRGFRNWLIPLICGCPDISFPWMNNWSFWLLLPSVVFIILSSIIRRVGARWTVYPPLSSMEQPSLYIIGSFIQKYIIFIIL